MFAPDDDMIFIVVQDENDQQVKLENDQVDYENEQVEYDNDQEIEYEEEYQEEAEEMVLDEVTGEIVCNRNASDHSWSVPSGDNDSQNHNQSSISSDSHAAAETNNCDISRQIAIRNPVKNNNRYTRVPKKPHRIPYNKKGNKDISPFHSKHRNRQLCADEAHSFVQEVRETFPELAHNEEMLITHLAELMRSVKVPPIPEGYSRFIGGLYQCSYCEKSTHTKLKSELHYLEIHGPRYLNCFSCGADFRCLPTLYRHERSCIHPDAGVVLKARALVSTKGSKRAAILSKDSKRRQSWLMCEVCQAVLSSKSSLEAHMCRHRNEAPYKCAQCSRCYTNRSSLVRHIKQHDEQNKYECELCQRAFGTRRTLLTHLNTHNKNWECPFKCGKYFATEAFRSVHVDAKHLNKPMPCACNLCQFKCFNISLLRCHMERKHGLIYMSDSSMKEEIPALNNTQLTTSTIRPTTISQSTETDQAVNHLKEIFYVNTPNAENCIEVTTAPNEEDYYEIVLSSNEVNGLKEGYYEVVTSKEGQAEGQAIGLAKSENCEEIIIGTEQEVCDNECEVDAPGVDCAS